MTRSSKHACAASGCLRQIPGKYLFCAPHWRQVPTSLQLAINASWEQFQREKAPAERLARVREYQKARNAAIEILGRAA